MAEDSSYEYELYVTSKGTIQVSNDVKIKVLHELALGNRSLTELSKVVGKAQSTLSVHLDRMVEDRLIAVHDDMNDNRKKYYTLTSLPFAKSVQSSDESREVAFGMLSKLAQDPKQMTKALPGFIFLGFDGMGLDASPMAGILGFIHGAAMSGSLSGTTLEDTVANTRDYFMEFGLGEATVFSLKPLTIIIKSPNPFTEGSSKVMQHYASGFMSKVLEDATGKPYDTVSSEVFGSDYNYLRFVMEPRENKLFMLEQGFE